MTAFRYVECPDCICGNSLSDSSVRIVKRFAWGSSSFVQCRRCRSLIQSPAIASDSLALWHDSGLYINARGVDEGPYLQYLADETQRKWEAKGRFRRDIEPHIRKPSRVLEIGCATGSMLSVIRDAGHEVHGVEVSARFAQLARSINAVNVTVADFRRFANPPGSFDLSLLLGTVSNLPFLDEHLTKAHTLLRHGGLLYLNVPVADSAPARLYGRHHWMFTPSVASFMTLRGAATALRKSGFVVCRIRVDRQRPTLSKLLGQTGLRRLYSLAERIGVASAQLPFSLPIPGVATVWARALHEPRAKTCPPTVQGSTSEDLT